MYHYGQNARSILSLTDQPNHSDSDIFVLSSKHQDSFDTIINDFSFDDIFDRQINALVNENDLVIGISTSGKSKNVLNGKVLYSDNNRIDTNNILKFY